MGLSAVLLVHFRLTLATPIQAITDAVGAMVAVLAVLSPSPE
ncbi:hypothetical protein [Streptomyces himalayensis]|nr:hypothetical protein [Streptomyces himalayensis]